MARTFTGPNLDAAVRAIERLMDDDCEITRDAQREFDEVLDNATGALTSPTHDSIVVYQGKCSVTAKRAYSSEQIGGERQALRDYDLTLPVELPRCVEAGDVVTVKASRRDSKLIGQMFVVTDVKSGTFNVSTRAELERR